MTPDQYRRTRRRLGLTQRQLAGELGITYVSVGRRERGEEPISREAELALWGVAAQAD